MNESAWLCRLLALLCDDCCVICIIVIIVAVAVLVDGLDVVSHSHKNALRRKVTRRRWCLSVLCIDRLRADDALEIRTPPLTTGSAIFIALIFIGSYKAAAESIIIK